MLCLPHWVVHFAIGFALALGLPPPATNGSRQALPVTTRPGGASSDAEQPSAERLLQEARDLEQMGQWAEALRRYEEVRRRLPFSPGPDEGAERCRCHLRVEARCRNAATRDFARQLTASRGVALYEEFLERISASYVEEVPLAPLVGRGVQNCVLAVQTPEFARTYGLRGGTEQSERWAARMAALKRGFLGAVLTPAEGADLLQKVLRANVETVAAADGAFVVEMIQGAVEGLDTYSAFLNPERLAALRTEIDGEFVGLGIRIALKDGAVVVVEPIEGSPAAAAGVRAGDRLLAVDGHGTEGLTLEEVARLLHGPVHGPVVVAVRHAGEAAPVALTVCRERIVLKSVTRAHRIVAAPPSGAHESHPEAGVRHPANRVGYVRISAFQKGTATELEEALKGLEAEGIDALILDLRGNPGGVLEAAVEVANAFLRQGVVVTTRGRAWGQNWTFRAREEGTRERLPLALLVDDMSASATEIVAAALRDHHRAMLVGTRTYGKGSVQSLFTLGKGDVGFRLTTARFYTPGGESFERTGIMPDVEIRLPEDARRGDPGEDEESDSQLAEALRYLRTRLLAGAGDAAAPAPR